MSLTRIAILIVATFVMWVIAGFLVWIFVVRPKRRGYANEQSNNQVQPRQRRLGDR